MQANWKALGIAAAIGSGAGVADQLVQNYDEKRALKYRALPANDPAYVAPDKKMPLMKEIGTYVDFGLPLLDVVAVAAGWVKGPMADVLITAAFQMAARKLTHRLSTKSTSAVPAAAYTALAAQMAAAARQAQQQLYVPQPNPQPIMAGPIVPNVTPQGLNTGLGDLG
jgi:hypothetical protein